MRDVALIFGPAGAKVPPELDELDPAEEEAMARRTSAQTNSNRKAGTKVNALLIVHQSFNSQHLLLELLLWYERCGPCGHINVTLSVRD